MPCAFKLLDQSENNCYPVRRIHIERVSSCESDDRVPSQRLHSSRELLRICAVVFSRFYGSHKIEGVEVGVELRGGVACSVASAILSTIAGLLRPDDTFTWRAAKVPLGSQIVGAYAATWVSERALRR